MTFYSGLLQRSSSGIEFSQDRLCEATPPEQREALDAYIKQKLTACVQ